MKLLLALLLLAWTQTRAQTFNGKNLRWEIPSHLRDNRCDLSFGSNGHSMGGEEMTVRLQNNHSLGLEAVVLVRVRDNCGNSKDYKFTRRAQPGKVAGESFFFDGTGLSSTCKSFRNYGDKFKTLIARAEVLSVVVRELGGNLSTPPTPPPGNGGNSGGSGNPNNGSGNPTNGSGGSGSTDPNLRPCRSVQPGLVGSAGALCATLGWNCEVASQTMVGNEYRQHNPVNEWNLQWRKRGAITWEETWAYGCPQVGRNIGGLEPCTEYEARLITLCKGQPSITGPTMRFTTACPAPQTPKAVEQWAGGKVKMNVRIGAGLSNCMSGMPANYSIEIQYKPANDPLWQSLVCGRNTNMDCILTGLKPNTQYAVRARARYANGGLSEFTRVDYFTVNSVRKP